MASKPIAKKVTSSKPGRFAVIGVINTLIDYSLFNILIQSGIGLIFSNTISTTVAMLASFFMNGKFVFGKSKYKISDAIIFFSVTLLGIWFIQNIGLLILSSLLEGMIQNEQALHNISKALASILSLTWNYFAYKHVVFNEKSLLRSRLRSYLSNLINKARKHLFTLLAILLGSLIVASNTAVATFSKWIHPDAISQNVAASTWLDGSASLFTVGATNYIIKTPFYFLVDIIGLPPGVSLVFMCMILNVATFLGLSIIILKISSLILEKKHIPLLKMLLLPGAILWLSVMSSSMFLLHYPNSRNIELLLGFLWFYYFLSTLYKPENFSLKILASAIILAGLCFFADPMQAYLIVVPCSLIMGLFAIRAKIKSYFIFSVVSLMGVAIGKLAQILVDKFTFFSFLDTPDSGIDTFSSDRIGESAALLIRDSFIVFSGKPMSLTPPYDISLLLIKLLILFFALIIILKIYISFKESKKLKRLFLVSAGVILLSPYLTLLVTRINLDQADTERYLIIVPIATILLILSAKSTKLLVCLYGLIAMLVFLTLAQIPSTLLSAYRTRFSENESRHQLIAALDKDIKIYTEFGDAAPITYFSSGEHTAVPVRCLDNGLEPRKMIPFLLLYERSLALKHSSRSVLVIDTYGGASKCIKDEIVTEQFGEPTGRETISTKFNTYSVYYFDYDIMLEEMQKL